MADSSSVNTRIVEIFGLCDDGSQYKDKVIMDNVSQLLPVPSHCVNLTFENILDVAKIGRKEKIIVNNCCGNFNSGQLIAVLGPSGAGKSSLLNILAGYKTSYKSGHILVNGIPKINKEFRKMSAYIMQDDLLLPNLTVGESMMVSAKLRISYQKENDIKSLVNNILKAFGLHDSYNTYVNKISGGQRKRLSIALELISNPSIIFLDEPTSGLDSQSALLCISLMKSLASQRRTVICTIHQPSARIFSLFDTVYLLSRGSCIYHGPRSKILNYFGSLKLSCPKYHNIADYIIEIAVGDTHVSVNHLIDSWSNKANKSIKEMTNKFSSLQKSHVDTNKSKCYNMITSPHSESVYSSSSSINYYSSHLIQFLILSQRSSLSTIRDKMFTTMTFIASILIALLVGGLYFKIGNDAEKVLDNVGCLFFCMIFIMLITLIPTVMTFPLEKLILLREHLNNWYSLKSYYAAKTLSDIPFQLASPLIFVVIVYFMTGQPVEFIRFAKFMSIAIITCFVAQSIGLLLGACAPNAMTAVYLAPIVGIPTLLYCGFFVKFETIPIYMKWMSYVSFAKYSWEAMLVSIYGNRKDPLKCKEESSVNLSKSMFCQFENAQNILKFFKVKEDAFNIENFSIGFNLIILLTFFLILRISTYIILKLLINKRIRI